MSKYLVVCGRADCPRPYGFCEACVRADERAAIMSRVKQDMTVDREKWTMLAQSVSAEQIRADERERIAQAIENDRDEIGTKDSAWDDGWCHGMESAARIARDGGRDE